MIIKYDFHIHTALSPCGDELMSPNNIVNMSLLNELDVIAITDHNTCGNCEAVMKVGKERGLLVIPGMEIECMEEFHLVTLFPTLEAAKQMEQAVKESMAPIKNRIDIFGNQHLMDDKDEIIGEEEVLLLTASSLSVYDIFPMVRDLGGIIYPAHIDRNSYSIISNLGFIPEDLILEAIEISKNAKTEEYIKNYPQYTMIRSSDAHYLQDISSEGASLFVESLSIKSIFKSIKTKC